MSMRHRSTGLLVGVTGAALALSGCDLGPKQVVQTGFRGTAMAQVTDLNNVKEQAAIPDDPYALPPDTGPRASEVYQNVQVLGDVSAERFNHLMAQITQWIAPPEQGCNYCHNPANMASDEVYTKLVARQMLLMTQQVNSTWSSHVKQTGVTCYTCHRGNAVPQYVWAVQQGTPNPNSVLGNKRGQNTPNPNVGYASLPYDPFALYLTGKANSRVAGKTIYPAYGEGQGKSTKEAEASYGFMMHLSTSLGVNCTFCHNTQSLGAWNLSRPQRATAYYGIRMVGDINDTHITPLTPIFPANRKGPQGDPYKVNCMTCHQGLQKPLGGVSMLARSPTLRGPVGQVAVAEDVGGAAGRVATEQAFDAPEAVNTSPAAAPADRPSAPVAK
ncbi:photosynthetic reaction center cytochrome PufC [Sphingomonas sp. S1-29]|uniref:photosynthetic reaction center cytochrome PufC n=1 Tax=Sphingomonas sp. S1-29 TaxID=2991074 RepID=UPI00223FC60F|nr:photosynthetic reaction center cytochrome PufC [Sphingomonas sp. S1-29]UZK69542.1 photosynthetic reaction center cytochrome PufC [Sphingomonas sp. S1-29]